MWAATSGSDPGNANLPIGDGTEAQDANREIGVPRIRLPATELTFELGLDRRSPKEIYGGGLGQLKNYLFPKRKTNPTVPVMLF